MFLLNKVYYLNFLMYILHFCNSHFPNHILYIVLQLNFNLYSAISEEKYQFYRSARYTFIFKSLIICNAIPF